MNKDILWCKKEFGFSGICHAKKECNCYCFREGDSSPEVQSAYFGEFGFDLLTNLPYLYPLASKGHLRSSFGPVGSKYYYYFSQNHTEVAQKRWDCGGGVNDINVHEKNYYKEDEWVPPPLKEHYGSIPSSQRPKNVNAILFSNKPLVVVTNKYHMEWGGLPVNFLNARILDRIFGMLKENNTVAYIRPRSKTKGYGIDEAPMQLPGEEKVLANHPEVWTLDTIMVAGDSEDNQSYYTDFNYAQLLLFAHAKGFITVQGGISALTSYFGGVNIVYAMRGKELKNPHEFEEMYPLLGGSTLILVNNYEDLLDAVVENFDVIASNAEGSESILRNLLRFRKGFNPFRMQKFNWQILALLLGTLAFILTISQKAFSARSCPGLNFTPSVAQFLPLSTYIFQNILYRISKSRDS